jgi:hypothetical protein
MSTNNHLVYCNIYQTKLNDILKTKSKPNQTKCHFVLEMPNLTNQTEIFFINLLLNGSHIHVVSNMKNSYKIYGPQHYGFLFILVPKVCVLCFTLFSTLESWVGVNYTKLKKYYHDMLLAQLKDN